jgi:hypothetical protein
MGGPYQKEMKALNANSQYICEQIKPEENQTFRKFQIVRNVGKCQVTRGINHDDFQPLLAVVFLSFALIDHVKTKKGYVMPFNRRFYVFTPPRSLEEIDAELKQVTVRILEMIGGLSA